MNFRGCLTHWDRNEGLKWRLREAIAHNKIRIQLGNSGPLRKERMAREIEEFEKQIHVLELEEVLTK